MGDIVVGMQTQTPGNSSDVYLFLTEIEEIVAGCEAFSTRLYTEDSGEKFRGVKCETAFSK